MVLPFVPVLVQAGLVAIASYYGGNMVYDEYIKDLHGSFDIYKLKFALNINVFGQTEALSVLVSNLQRLPPHNGAEVIVLYGGVGVGKSLAMSLVREHYQPDKLIINLMQNSLEDISNVDKKFAQQLKRIGRIQKGVALVTIDNADVSSVQLWSFIKQLDDMCKWELKVKAKVVIGAQLFQDTNSESVRNLISNSFRNEEEYSSYILDKNKNACKYFKQCTAIFFKPVNLDTLKMCINASAKSLTRTELSEKQMEFLMGQIADVGLDYVPAGCKSVDNYVGLLHDGL